MRAAIPSTTASIRASRGKPAGYLYNQLRNFQDGRRHYPVMTYLTEHLPDAYLREIAAHFAAQAPTVLPPTPMNLSPAQRERGRQLVHEGDRGRASPRLHRLPWRAPDGRRSPRSRACSACHAITSTRSSAPGATACGAPTRPIAWARWPRACRPTMSPPSRAGWRRSQCRPIHGQPMPSPGRCRSPVAARHDEDHSHRSSRGGGRHWPRDPAGVAARRLRAGQLARRLGGHAGQHRARRLPGAGRRLHGLPHGARRRRRMPAGARSIRRSGACSRPNITPDRDTGIGAWSADDFWNALHNGKSREWPPAVSGLPVHELHEGHARRCGCAVRLLSQPAATAPGKPAARDALPVQPAGVAGRLAPAVLPARRIRRRNRRAAPAGTGAPTWSRAWVIAAPATAPATAWARRMARWPAA